MKTFTITATMAAISLVVTTNAFAYVGPGLGVGAITAILGIIAFIFLSVFAIVWYPIKRLIAKLKKSRMPKSEIK